MQMKNKSYNPVSAGVSYTIGNMLIKGIPFLTLPIFTRILSTEDFGLYNIYLSYENIISILLGVGLAGTNRIAKVYYKEKFEDYISSIFCIQIIIATFFDVIICFLFSFFVGDGWFDEKILVILLVNCLCTQLYNIASGKYAINGEVWQNLMISFVMTFCNVGISLLLCCFLFEDEAYLGRILGTCIAAIIVTVYVVGQQIKRSRKFFVKEYWRFGLRMGAPLILHSLSLTLLAQCDKIMIKSIVGSSEAGIYSIAVTLSSIVSVLITSFDNAWAPWFFFNLEEKKYNIIYKYNNLMIIFFTVITVSIMLISPEIIRVMSAREYWDSVFSFPPLLLSILFNFYYLIPVNFEYYCKQTSYIATSTIIIALLNIVLNYILITLVGYIGAAYATCISKLILFLMHWRKAWKLEAINLMGKKIIASSSILSITICVYVIIFNVNIIARYSMLGVILIIAFYQANKKGLFIVLRTKISWIKK